MWTVMKEAMPMKVTGVLFLKRNSENRGDMAQLFRQRVMALIAGLWGSGFPHTVVVDSTLEAYQKLVEFGVPLDCIPASHGGTWTYDRALEWNERFTKDTQQYKAIRFETNPFAENRASSSDTEARVKPKPKRKPKKNNALYCRRAYSKRKQRHTQIEEDALRLQAEHAMLMNEYIRLQLLVQQALEVVTSSQDSMYQDVDDKKWTAQETCNVPYKEGFRGAVFPST